MEFKRKSKIQTLPNNGHLNAETNLMDLPTEMLFHVARNLSLNKLKNFSLVNKKCQEVYQHILNNRLRECIDLRKFFCLRLKEKENLMLERVKNINYKSVNLRNCYQLSPWLITKLLCKQSIQELDLFECECTPEITEAVSKLNLVFLTISLCGRRGWREFFIINEKQSVPVFNGLKKLEIFSCHRTIFLMSFVARFVLPHCRQLQYLKLSSTTNTLHPGDIYMYTPKLISTPVPQLETLVLDFHINEDISLDINTFLETIFFEKKFPLTNIYLGQQTYNAISRGIFGQKNISFENVDTFCLSGCADNYSNLKGFEAKKSVIDPMLQFTQIKKIVIKNLYIMDFTPFTESFVNSGNASVEEVSLEKSTINKGLCNFIVEISNLCLGITFMDISDWPKCAGNNIELMNSLTHLTNLRTLHIVSSMLRSEINGNNVLKEAFLEVTMKCKFLKCLRIVDKVSDGLITQEVLSCIRCFKNLRELRLVNFTTIGSKAVLGEIVKSCSRLKYLHIESIRNETGFEEILSHAKGIKYLYLDDCFEMTKTFIYNLSQCAELEKLYVVPLNVGDEEIDKYLAESVKKLSKLRMFGSHICHVDLAYEHFVSAMEKIKEMKPWFLFHFACGYRPIAYYDFLINPAYGYVHDDVDGD